MTSGIVLIPFLCLWSPSVWADTDCIRDRACGWIFSPHQRLQGGTGMCSYAVPLMEFYWKQQLMPSKSGCLAPTLGLVLSASQRVSNLASGVLQWNHVISPLCRSALRLRMASEISSLFESDCTRIHLRQLSLRIHSWSIGRGGLMCILIGAKVSANIRSGHETQPSPCFLGRWHQSWGGTQCSLFQVQTQEDSRKIFKKVYTRMFPATKG